MDDGTVVGFRLQAPSTVSAGGHFILIGTADFTAAIDHSEEKHEQNQIQCSTLERRSTNALVGSLTEDRDRKSVV